MTIEARPWRPQDLLDDLQGLIDEEPDRYLNTRRATLCMALDYLKEHFAEKGSNEPLSLEELRKMDGRAVWCEDYRCNGIVSVDKDGGWAGIPFLIMRIRGIKCTYNIENRELTVYARRPDGTHEMGDEA